MNIGFIDIVHPVLNKMLEEAGHKCQMLDKQSREELKILAGTLDGIVIRSRTRMDKDFLQQAPHLKFIARSGAGMENIDLDYCKSRNIICFNSPEGNRDAVGEQAIGMLLMLFNHLKRADDEVRRGIWLREENRGEELAGKTVALIGYGNMGSALGKKLSGFDCEILAYDKYKTNYGSTYAKESSWEEIHEKADVLSLHVPLTEETHYLVNADRIAKFKKPFYLINTARGQNVKTEDLVAALKQGKIKGACLDVLEYEKSSFEHLEIDKLPEPMQYLVSAQNVILSPHVGGWTHESYYKLSYHLGEKILKEFGRVSSL